MEEKIEIHKVRDFSGVFSDSINFIKHNFKSIGKSLVVIVAPMYTLATILVSFLSVRIIDVMDNSRRTFTTYGNAGRDKVLALFLDPTLWLAILAYLFSDRSSNLVGMCTLTLIRTRCYTPQEQHT